jgi:hypothetical protein
MRTSSPLEKNMIRLNSRFINSLKIFKKILHKPTKYPFLSKCAESLAVPVLKNKNRNVFSTFFPTES